MTAITISMTTARRFILGRQGLWPGRRWMGAVGTRDALMTIEAVQLDPLNVVARSHDIALWGRVLDYQPAYLDDLLYRERAAFETAGALFAYPMAELPFWRVQMANKAQEPRWASFAAKNQALLDEVRAQLRARGPLGSRDLDGAKLVDSYRGRKETSLALFYLWQSGVLLIHHRQGFERKLDFREHLVPPALDTVATAAEAQRFFARKTLAFHGLLTERRWITDVRGATGRRLTPEEVRGCVDELTSRGVVVTLSVEGSRERFVALADDLPVLETVAQGSVPESWRPLASTTRDEVVFLAPLDIVSARGRATWLFDFEYIWEVYKPEAARRWGYYTLPILYDDRLVGRLDPKLDRSTATLVLNGFWLEPHAPLEDPDFASALARGLRRFASFVQAERMDLDVVAPATLRASIKAALEAATSPAAP